MCYSLAMDLVVDVIVFVRGIQVFVGNEGNVRMDEVILHKVCRLKREWTLVIISGNCCVIISIPTFPPPLYVLLSEMGVLLSEMGVLWSEMGVLLSEMGVLLSEMGVLLNEMGVLLSEMGVLLSQMGNLMNFK